MPENRLAIMGGVAVKNISNDKGVAFPVASHTQMVRAKLAILEPKMEAVCPIQMMRNVRRLVGGVTIGLPPLANSEIDHQ